MQDVSRTDQVRFLFLEPFDGGSHGQFARGLVGHSRFDIDLVSLPARFWKWRMRGAALHFARAVKQPQDYCGLMVSGLMSLADLKAMWGKRCPPALVYFHETQLTYPNTRHQERDAHFAFTDLTTALCAQRVLFNSASHRDRFFSALERFLRRLPDCRPLWALDELAAKTGVVMPGCDFPDRLPEPAPAGGPPLIVWNHRWEHDKNPEAFFRSLEHLEKLGIDFRLALLGQRFATIPEAFARGLDRFAAKIVCRDYQPGREQYYRMLSCGHLAVSTARQENFGLAVVEAIGCGCLPILPRRLSYPEIVPRRFHRVVFYDDDDTLGAKLAEIVGNLSQLAQVRRELAAAMDAFAWRRRIRQFDSELARLAHVT